MASEHDYKYEYESDDVNAEKLVCESCEYPAPVARFEQLDSEDDEGFKSALLCELCASTMASRAKRYPSLYDEQTRVILQATCYVGNAIIHAKR
jgi:hypothetical protein